MRNMFDSPVCTFGPMHNLITTSSIATTLKRMGKILATQQKYELAYGAIFEALSMLQTEYATGEELELNDFVVDLPKYQDEVASVLYALAEAKQAGEKYAEAITLYQEAFQLRIASDQDRLAGQKSNRIHCAMSLAGIGSVHLKKDQPNEAFKCFSEAIQFVKMEGLTDSHPIVAMFWDKSYRAACMMLRDEKESASLEKREVIHADPWSYAVSRLEEKAELQKEEGDLHGCANTMRVVVDIRRNCLTKVRETDPNTELARQQLASSLLALGRLELIVQSSKRGMMCFKEALRICEASKLSPKDLCVQEIEEHLKGMLYDLPSRLEDTKAEI